MRRLMLVLTLAALAACGSTEPGDDVRGSYTLESVNGQPLPYTYALDFGFTSTVTDGLVIVTPDGKWSWLIASTFFDGTTSTPQQSMVFGTWTSSGNTLTLKSDDPPTLVTATVNGDALTITKDGNAYLFRR